MCKHICTYSSIDLSICIHIYIYLYVNMHTHIYTHIYVFMLYTYVCIYIHLYTFNIHVTLHSCKGHATLKTARLNLTFHFLVGRFQKINLLIVQYKYTNCFAENQILQDLILHARLYGTAFITHPGGLIYFHTTQMVVWKYFVPVVTAPKGYLGGVVFFNIIAVWIGSGGWVIGHRYTHERSRTMTPHRCPGLEINRRISRRIFGKMPLPKCLYWIHKCLPKLDKGVGSQRRSRVLCV